MNAPFPRGEIDKRAREFWSGKEERKWKEERKDVNA